MGAIFSGTMLCCYVQVERTDTIERIAAKCDVTPSTLMKLNRMTSRMVFENQVMPDLTYSVRCTVGCFL